MRSAAACASRPLMCSTPTGSAGSISTAPCVWGCGTSAASVKRSGGPLKEWMGRGGGIGGVGQRISLHPHKPHSPHSPLVCPKCGCDDKTMLEVVRPGSFFCNTCSHDWAVPTHPPSREALRRTSPSHRFASVDDLVNRTGIRREELQTLADIGAIASFGY